MKIGKYFLTCLAIAIGCSTCFRYNAQKNKKPLEFFNENGYFVPLKISQFSSGNIPQIEIQIENNTISSAVDLGLEGGLVLPKGMISTLNKASYIYKKTLLGVRGKTYQSDVYELPEIKIGKLKIFPMQAIEESDEFIKDSVLQEKQEGTVETHLGRIGWHAFQSFNLLLDCDHFVIAICDSLNTLKQQGYSIHRFVEAPLLLDRGSIDFEVMTETGPLRCVLDSGSTWNLLNKDISNTNQDHRLMDFELLKEKPPEINPNNNDLLIFDSIENWKTNIFNINGSEFGPINFVKIKSPLGVDAVVGMEFIDNHLIFIDFKNKKIYFSKLPTKNYFSEKICDWIGVVAQFLRSLVLSSNRIHGQCQTK